MKQALVEAIQKEFFRLKDIHTSFSSGDIISRNSRIYRVVRIIETRLVVDELNSVDLSVKGRDMIPAYRVVAENGAYRRVPVKYKLLNENFLRLLESYAKQYSEGIW